MKFTYSDLKKLLSPYVLNVISYSCRDISGVRIYEPGMRIEDETLYLVDASRYPTLPSTDTGSYLFYGSLIQPQTGLVYATVDEKGSFEEFVNHVNAAFLLLASSPDRITERISVLARCQSVQQLLDVGSELLNCGVLLADMNYSLMAASCKMSEENTLWHRILALKEIPLNLATSTPWMNSWQDSVTTGLPCAVEDPLHGVQTHIFAVKDVSSQLGLLLADTTGRNLTEFEQEIIMVLGRFLSVALKSRSDYRMAKRSSFDHFFCYLLQGRIYPESMMAQRTASLSWEPGEYMRILVFHSEILEDPGSFVRYSDIIRDLPRNTSGRAVFFEGDVVLIICSDQRIDYKSPQIQRLIQYVKDNNLLTGISREFQSLQSVRQVYLQARDALDIGAVFDHQRQIYWYEDYADYRLLQHCAKTIDLREFCHPGLLQLYNGDRKNGTNYIETLRVYLENQRSISKTAQALHIHRNTVTYRVEQCLAACNTDLGNRNNLLHVLLSLNILEFLSVNPENQFRAEPFPTAASTSL